MEGMNRLTEDTALDYVSGVCFKTGPPRRVGVELEWFPRDLRHPHRLPDPDRLHEAFGHAAELALDGALSMEPGGQWELSSRPVGTLPELVAVTDRDMTLLRAAAGEHGLELVGVGHECGHPPRRVFDSPRYAAMEEFFDRDGPWGRVMMCCTASIQLNIDAGTDDEGPTGFRHRWRLAHLLRPVLAAAFPSICRPAAEPLPGLAPQRPAGHLADRHVSRLDVWSRLDPSRTVAPDYDAPDPRSAYAQYALDARLLCLPGPDGVPWTVPKNTTFRDWIRDGADGSADGPDRPATLADLDYHLTTLFPPVRAHGHLELRTIDALPGDSWHVPAALITALFDDASAAEQAAAVLVSPRIPLRNAVQDCFDLAVAALSRSGDTRSLRDEVARYAEEEIRWN
jgi:glutamate--cysteine ligase